MSRFDPIYTPYTHIHHIQKIGNLMCYLRLWVNQKTPGVWFNSNKKFLYHTNPRMNSEDKHEKRREIVT